MIISSSRPEEEEKDRNMPQNFKNELPPAAIPDAAARASKRPTAINGYFGKESISSVTLPA